MRRNFFILFFLCYFLAKAQDVHYSQFDKTSSLLNPSLLGIQQQDYEIQLQRRSQWSSITTPFKTFSLAINAKNIYKKISLSATLLNDIAGDSRFSTDGISLSFSKSVNTQDNVFAFGIQSSFYQRSVNYDELIFFENESVQNTRFNFLDLSIGVSNYKAIDSERSFLIALSSFHLNKPKQSLTSSGTATLNQKHVFYAKYYSNLNLKIKTTPAIYASSQGNDKEFVIGSGMSYNINDEFDLKTGGYYRIKDAFFITLGIRKTNLEAIVSYDINTSSLAEASNSFGGFEFSIIYGWSIIKEIKEPIHLVCPSYL